MWPVLAATVLAFLVLWGIAEAGAYFVLPYLDHEDPQWWQDR